MSEPLITVRDLKVYFQARQGLLLPWCQPTLVRAVDGVSFDIQRGEVLAMVGESGCGKTTIGKAILHIILPTAGQIIFDGTDLGSLSAAEMRLCRCKMQPIFQDPYESLDPSQTIFDAVAEPLRIHRRSATAEEIAEQVYAALEAAGLYPSREIASRYPHHLSGGQRQRVVIASAMVLNPQFIVADEPVSMLDVSIRAEILKLMLDLRRQRNLTYLFITHDLSLAWVIADRILVLYLGKMMELGPAEQVIASPLHPYTQALVSVIPLPEPAAEKKLLILSGETPSPINVPPGCCFHPRCWLRQQLGNPVECHTQTPQLRQIRESHSVACHFVGTA